jgi:hypothetical protein
VRTSLPVAVRTTHRIALPIALPSAPEAPGQWVVCGGAFREASGGRVACPLQGTPVAIGECLGCHCLVTHSGERDPGTDCATTELS